MNTHTNKDNKRQYMAHGTYLGQLKTKQFYYQHIFDQIKFRVVMYYQTPDTEDSSMNP